MLLVHRAVQRDPVGVLALPGSLQRHSSLRTAKVAGQDDSRIVFEQVFNRRQRLLDTRIVSDIAVFIKGYVKVCTDKNAFVFDIDVGYLYLLLSY